VGAVLYEPAGAVTRAGGIAQLGADLDARLLHTDVVYLTGDVVHPTPYATAFEVLEVHPYTEQALRHWARDRGIGTLEIKKRGLDLDPAVLRKRLKLRGRASATVVLTRGSEGTLLIVVRRLSRG
ncbi:MAG TPA: class I SAM-dependent methyltransferase, partial [Microlunatus sp.]